MDDIYIMNSTFVGFNCLWTNLVVKSDSVMFSVHSFPYYWFQILKISQSSANFRTVAIFLRINQQQIHNTLQDQNKRFFTCRHQTHTEKYKYYMPSFFDTFHAKSNSMILAYLQRPSYKNSEHKGRVPSVTSNNNSFFCTTPNSRVHHVVTANLGKLQLTKLGLALSDVALLKSFLNTTLNPSEGN